ncbi:MAG: hypothetical protein B9J98_02705 [Candidatus Terraquivivens tikiterensis]|uniref:Enoyl-CoA hydratase n=1 Tax=Candidatus Terraquivivens tikiterensis TaxID=1980982 RepID=A0A2R7Y647_9ARCH|nr:MAG: hypothetical protein B9J98_02705 [Candidatus Terraquivivens tikiterensis]
MFEAPFPDEMLKIGPVHPAYGGYEGLEFEKATFALLYSSEDAEEGLTPFLAKRRPVWKGK